MINVGNEVTELLTETTPQSIIKELNLHPLYKLIYAGDVLDNNKPLLECGVSSWDNIDVDNNPTEEEMVEFLKEEYGINLTCGFGEHCLDSYDPFPTEAWEFAMKIIKQEEYNEYCSEGYTNFDFIVVREDINGVRVLLEHGASPSTNGLKIAVGFLNVEMTKLLLDYGADVHSYISHTEGTEFFERFGGEEISVLCGVLHGLDGYKRQRRYCNQDNLEERKREITRMILHAAKHDMLDYAMEIARERENKLAIKILEEM